MAVSPLAKYLARHAEPQAALASRVRASFGHAVQIPAYGETESLFRALASTPTGPLGDVLIVLVLNARADSPREVHEANERVRERLRTTLAEETVLSTEHPASLFALPRGALLALDCARPGHYLPEGQGVGLARKIGCDLLLRLRAEGRLASPWIHCTDADAILPPDYFEQTGGLPEETGAALYAFEHRFDPDARVAEAGRVYEISLRYAVLGLAWSGSPYAYPSLGSCIAVRAEAYAAVRGFPRRNALEDFYALNKLAKVAPIARLSGAPVEVEGRLSERVPISTGQALTEMMSGARGKRFSLYHPVAFAHLAAFLRVLADIARTRDVLGSFHRLPETNPLFRGDVLREALQRMGAFAAIRAALDRSADSGTVLRHLHTWFDAFRTIKLLHALRNGGVPSLPWRQALAEAPFTGLTASTEDDSEILRVALRDAEQALPRETGVPSLALGAFVSLGAED